MRLVLSSIALLAFASIAQAQASLVGYVRDDESLRGLPGVELSVDGSEKKVRTDKDGKYTLKDLSPGGVRLHIRSVGFAPIDTILEVAGGKPTEGVFFLGKHAVPLDTVVTTKPAPLGSGFESFELRRAKGFGRFIDSVYLRQHESQSLADLIINLGSVNVVRPSTCHGDRYLGCNRQHAVAKRNVPDVVCLVEVVLDGHVMQKGAVIDDRTAPINVSPRVREQYEDNKFKSWGFAFDLNSLNVSSLRGVELYRSAAEAPDQFGGDDAGCGVLVLWSRRG